MWVREVGLDQDRSVYCRPVSLWVSDEVNSPLTDAPVSDTERSVSAPHRHRTLCTERHMNRTESLEIWQNINGTDP